MTDSDSAGFMIRSFLGGMLDNDKVKHVYIPDILGKEKRKDKPSKEGKLGVEGLEYEKITQALKKSGILTTENEKSESHLISSADFYEFGFSGKDNSVKKRKALLKYFELPERLSSSSLIKLLNAFISYEDFIKAAEDINNEEKL